MTERQQAIAVTLEAHHPERNHHRVYEVVVGQDLLFDWVVTVRYGRTRTAGRVLRYPMTDLDAARAFVRTRLRRRLTAPRRIGCAYQITRTDLASGEAAGGWLPAELKP